MAESIRPFKIEVPEAVLDGSARAARPHALARPDPRHGLGATAPTSPTCSELCAYWRDDVRLARRTRRR